MRRLDITLDLSCLAFCTSMYLPRYFWDSWFIRIFGGFTRIAGASIEIQRRGRCTLIVHSLSLRRRHYCPLHHGSDGLAARCMRMGSWGDQVEVDLLGIWRSVVRITPDFRGASSEIQRESLLDTKSQG